MIGRIRGTLIEKSPALVLVETGGLGYELEVPMSTFCDLPAVGANVVLLTHYVVREEAHLLYGFLSTTERRTFRELIRISGVGPRIALALLSGMSVDELSAAVLAQEPARLVRIPGIGKKTAERLLLELKGRLEAPVGLSAGGAPAAVAGGQDDALRALLALGYVEREALAALRDIPADLPLPEAIRRSLRVLAKG